MTPDNNSNPNPDNSPVDENPLAPAGTTDQPTATATAPAVDSFSQLPPRDVSTSQPLNSSSDVDLPDSTPPLPNTQISPTTPDSPSGSTPKKKSGSRLLLKGLVFALLGLTVLGGVAYAAFSYGKSQAPEKKVTAVQVTTKPISLPPQAIVISECTAGRGKQYIIPKDIPQGPIYDVHNSKVIAIEYVMGVNALFKDSDSFSTAILSLAKNYPVDHFALVPGQPKKGDKDQYLHLIMFVVPKKEAAAIKCSDTSKESSSSSSSNTSNGANTNTTTPTTDKEQTQ